jgi:hypothetical protein
MEKVLHCLFDLSDVKPLSRIDMLQRSNDLMIPLMDATTKSLCHHFSVAAKHGQISPRKNPKPQLPRRNSGSMPQNLR